VKGLSSLPLPDQHWGPPSSPPIKWVPGALSPEGGRDADHSLPSSAEDKNTWRFTCTSPYVYVEWHLVTHRDNFNLPYRTLLYYYFAGIPLTVYEEFLFFNR
jgi:hypothetical protein